MQTEGPSFSPERNHNSSMNLKHAQGVKKAVGFHCTAMEGRKHTGMIFPASKPQQFDLLHIQVKT